MTPPPFFFQELEAWAAALIVQKERVFSDADFQQAIIDARLFVLVLRNVARAAEALRDAGQPGADAALRTFENHIPYYRLIRNVIEHFDDYTLGNGSKKPSTPGGRIGLPAYGHTIGAETFLIQVLDLDASGNIVQSFNLQLADAAAAAQALVAAIS